MPDSKPHIELSEDQYINVYDLSGISVGTPLLIQNTTSRHLRLHIGETQPNKDTKAYTPIPSEFLLPAYIYAGEVGCWAYTGYKGPLNVQEDA